MHPFSAHSQFNPVPTASCLLCLLFTLRGSETTIPSDNDSTARGILTKRAQSAHVHLCICALVCVNSRVWPCGSMPSYGTLQISDNYREGHRKQSLKGQRYCMFLLYSALLCCQNASSTSRPFKTDISSSRQGCGG